VIIGLLIGVILWWGMPRLDDRKDPLNKAEAFVYSDNGTLNWLELTNRRGKVEGNFYQQKLLEEIGKVPVLEEKKSSLTGKTTKNGYEWILSNGEDITKYNAVLVGANLFVKKQGEKDNLLFEAMDHKQLDKKRKTLQQELELAIYHSEEKENNRLRKFFTDLRNVYGYLYSSEKESFQLFIKIDEALLEGELSGSLLVLEHTENINNPYEETKYILNGITDGLMLEFSTIVDGKETRLKGDFHGDAFGFDLSFWKTTNQLSFHAVTEEEFNQSYEENKKKSLK
jgi:hypothetical protein